MFRSPPRIVLACLLASCGLTPDFPADAAAFEPELQAFDARGESASLDSIPRRPRLSLALAAPPSASAAAGPWLLTGAADDALLDDLEKLPLTAAHQARSVGLRSRWDGQRLQLEPLEALSTGALYTLALPRKAAMHAFTVELHVDASPQAGAAVRSTFPNAETVDVPNDLAMVLIGFDGNVQGLEAGIWLENSQGLALAAHVEDATCDNFDSAAASCVLLRPEDPLDPASRYQLRSGRALQDAHGAAVDELHTSFSTREQDAAEPAANWQLRPCDVDQQQLPIGCVLVTDAAVELAVFQNPAQRVVARLAGKQLATLASAIVAPLRFTGLTANTPYTLEVDSIDARLRIETLSWELQTAPTLPTIVISEVDADPAGPEPDQEFVELWNFGSAPASLAGLCLSDSARDLGTPLPESVTLPASAHALLVSDAYDAGDPRDALPAAGSILVRMGKSVTRAGLANGGEKLFLRTCDGVRVSSSPAQPQAREGQCLVRTSSPKTDQPAREDWTVSACSPGR